MCPVADVLRGTAGGGTTVHNNAPLIQVDQVNASNPADVDAFVDTIANALLNGEQRGANRASIDAAGAQ
jgi:hypothetical protein